MLKSSPLGIIPFIVIILLVSLFLIKNPPKVSAYTNNSLQNLTYVGNVGIGTTEASPSATPTSSPSADLTPPSVDIFSPTIGSIIKGITQIFANAFDNVAVDRVEFFVDGNYLGVGSSSPYSALWDTTKEASDSGHMLSARAVDTSGNEASSGAVWVWVDNTPPYVNLLSPLTGSLVSGMVALEASAWDGIGLSKVDFFVDGVLAGSKSSYPYLISWNTSSLSALSTHVIYAKAYDLAGHEAISNTATVTIADITSPTTSITSPSGGTTVSGIVNVTALGSDNVAVTKLEFYVDGVLQTTDFDAPYILTWDTTGYINNSSHTLYTKAYDGAGNAGASPVVSVVAQDITSPSVVITSPVNGSTVPKNSTVTILAAASDISGISKVEFYVNGILRCSDIASAYSCPWKVPSRKNVTYTLQAKAYDTAGNTATNIVSVTSK